MNRENAKSVTLYLGQDAIDRIILFAERTVRSRSQAAEYLIRIGMDQFSELGIDTPEPDPIEQKKPAAKKSIASAPKAVPKRRGRSPKTPALAADSEAPKPVVRKPAKKVAAKKPATRQKAAKPAAAKKVVRKPRAKKSA